MSPKENPVTAIDIRSDVHLIGFLTNNFPIAGAQTLVLFSM
jgi:hypothetical protein